MSLLQNWPQEGGERQGFSLCILLIKASQFLSG